MAEDTTTAKRRAKLWLEDVGWTVLERKTLPEPIQWALEATNKAHHNVDILQFSDDRDMICLQATVHLSDEHRAIVQGLPKEEVAAMVWDLTFKLLLLGVDFDNLEPDLNKPVTFSQTLAYDGMTKDTFLQRVAQIRRAIILFIWTMQRMEKTRAVPVS